MLERSPRPNPAEQSLPRGTWAEPCLRRCRGVVGVRRWLCYQGERKQETRQRLAARRASGLSADRKVKSRHGVCSPPRGAVQFAAARQDPGRLLSALRLRAVSCAGADLHGLRSRQSLLRQAMCRPGPPRVATGSGAAAPAESVGASPACRSDAGLPRAAATESDAS